MRGVFARVGEAFKHSTLVQLWQVLGSSATLFIFFTGYSSLPALFGTQAKGSDVVSGVLPRFDVQTQVALVLVGVPLFNFLDTWLAVAVSRLLVHFLNGLGIDCHKFSTRCSRVYYVNAITVTLPMVVGLNVLFLHLLFGDIISAWPIAFGSVSVLVTLTYYIYWFRRWRFPEPGDG